MDYRQLRIQQRKLEQRQVNASFSLDCELEPNHTHFVLFDDATDGVENILLKREQIERQLSRTLIQPKSADDDYRRKSSMYCQD